MKRWWFILLASLLIPPLISIKVQAKMQVDEGLVDEFLEEPLPVPEDEGYVPPEEEEVIEGEEEEVVEEDDAQVPEARPPAALPAARPRVEPPPTVAGGEPGEGEELRDVIIDGLVNLNYVFENSPDSFVLKYHFHLEGKIAAKAAVIKGNARIKAEAVGFLAKWPTGECKLIVEIPDAPFQLSFRKTNDARADINLTFPRPITETWESKCTFTDTPGAKFDTKGEPEKWLAQALAKASPPLSRLTVNLSNEESTTMKFQIRKQTIKDPPLGGAEVDGTGVVTIKPSGAE